MNLTNVSLNPLIFRAYDIRGIADSDLKEESVYRIGQATGTYFIRTTKTQNSTPVHLVVGRDNRLSGEKLQHAFIQGLLSTGCHVTNMGLATSPLVYYATCAPVRKKQPHEERSTLPFDGGINITASHNPKEYNGIKIVAKNAHSICGEELQKILEIAQKEKFESGRGSYHEDTDIFEHYLNHVTKNIRLQRPMRVVIDSGNATTGAFAPRLLRSIGAEVIELFCDLDGNFPHHEANPEDEHNLEELKKAVVKNAASLGIGFDGDGDRIGVIDHTGKFYSADYLLILFSRDLLSRHPKAKIVFDVKSSKILENDIKKLGGVPLMEKTGHSFIEQAMKEENALLAGEASGHMFFAEDYYGFDDAMLAALRLLHILDKNNTTFKDALADLPETHTTPEIRIPCSDDKKFEIMKQLTNYFKERYPSTTIDGIRMNFNETDWAVIRCSNTTPALTLRFEAQTKQNLQKIQQIVFDKLKEYKI